MLELVGEQFVIAAEVDESGALVGKFEPDLLDLAGVFAAAFQSTTLEVSGGKPI